jgi:tetratricopeptide (TPR) repeat protein
MSQQMGAQHLIEDWLKERGLSNAELPEDSLKPGSADFVEIHGYLPLYEAIEWQLSQCQWNSRGVAPFIGNEVPYLVNNSGWLSRAAARILFANCEESHPREPEILVMECGAGTGLFALLLLEEFAAICLERDRDYFQRLCYVVTDASQQTVRDWETKAVFANYADHVFTGVADATCPDLLTTNAGETLRVERVQAYFLNYVLDSLPATIVRKNDGRIEELCLQARITRDERLRTAFTDLDEDAIARLFRSSEARDREALVRLSPLVEFDTRFEAVHVTHSGEDAAMRLLEQGAHQILNFGALQSLESCLGNLAPKGFVLVQDYGSPTPESVEDKPSSQRFGDSIALGLNFRLSEEHFGAERISAPPGDAENSLHTRVLAAEPIPQTRSAVASELGLEAYTQIAASLSQARYYAAAGDTFRAREAYLSLIDKNGGNWPLLAEAAEYLVSQPKGAGLALRLVQRALRSNPKLSPWLWNILGDALYSLGHFEHAHAAYGEALEIDRFDPRTNLNLAFSYQKRRQPAEALQAIASGFAGDAAGAFREVLSAKQEEILVGMAERQQARERWELRRNYQVSSCLGAENGSATS